jgi:hypothetical protein
MDAVPARFRLADGAGRFLPGVPSVLPMWGNTGPIALFRRTPLTVMLITALRAAETLAAFHRQRMEQTLGERQAYHRGIVEILKDEVDRPSSLARRDGQR